MHDAQLPLCISTNNHCKQQDIVETDDEQNQKNKPQRKLCFVLWLNDVSSFPFLTHIRDTLL